MKLSDETLYNQYLQKHKRKQNRGHNSQDSERQKTYEAEFAMLRKVGNVEYDSIEQVQKVAKSIYKSKTWGKLWSTMMSPLSSVPCPLSNPSYVLQDVVLRVGQTDVQSPSTLK
jgi:hypothetical protein